MTSTSGNPIFIGGVPRSGTTLLRVILDSHSHIYCGTELRVVPALTSLWSGAKLSGAILEEWYGVSGAALRSAFADLVMSFIRPAWEASGKPRVAEKTPWNLLVFPELRQLFPNSPLIHVIRDGRDVVASRLERDRASGADVGSLDLVRQRAQEWLDGMQLARAMRSDSYLSAQYFELRYELLVTEPERILRDLFNFTGVEFEPEVLNFHRTARNVDGDEEWSAAAVAQPIFSSSRGRWRAALTVEQQDAVVGIIGDALLELGYMPASESGG